MSTPLYDALVTKVRDWSNRDSESLPDSIIKDSLGYASETAYRELRLQGMEKVYSFEADNDGNTFNVPSDLKEYISLRQLTVLSIQLLVRKLFLFQLRLAKLYLRVLIAMENVFSTYRTLF